MKKKILGIMLALTLALGSLSLIGCGHTHSYTDVVTPANCIEQGYTTHTCDCGESFVDTYTDPLGEDGHIEVDMQDVSATCIKAGTSGGKECSVCKKVLVAPQTVPATGHSFSGSECTNCGTKKPSSSVEYVLAYNGTNYCVRGFKSGYSTNNLVIADVYEGLPVTEINSNAFKGNSIQSLYIPSGITRIGSGAFESCTALTDATLPDTLVSIESNAFKGCTTLANMEVPDSVTTVGANAFYGCEFSNDITLYTKYDNVNYVGNAQNPHLILVAPIDASLQVYEIHPNTKIISAQAFRSCIYLASIDLPDGLKTIGASAFESCTALADVSIPDTVTTIGDGAFNSCPAINYTESGNVKYLGNSSNPYLVAMGVVDKSEENFDMTLNGGTKIVYYKAFADYVNLKSINIPEGVLSIGAYALSGCTNLGELVIPESVENIGTNAFKGSSFTTVTFAENCKITNISSYAFSGCYRLQSVVIPDSVTIISSYAFQSCTNLTSVTIGSSVEIMYGKAFKGCSKLTSITIPENVNFIAECMFESCTDLNSVTFEGNSSWQVGSSRTMSASDLTSPSSNANYLKSSQYYRDYVWKRIV